MHTDQSFGLGSTLHAHRHKFGGILNGLDYDVWNPARPIRACAALRRRDPRPEVRQQARCGSACCCGGPKPIIAFVGRLDSQKGVHLIRHALFYASEHAPSSCCSARARRRLDEHFWQLKRRLNDNPDCHLELGFDEDLSHLIYAGADMVVVPSLYEPCGLTQLIGLRYGTVPIVRATAA